MGHITIKTFSGSTYELDLESNPMTFTRNGCPVQRLIEYRVYDNSYQSRYFGADDNYTGSFDDAEGKFLFVHGVGVDNWFESTRIVSISFD